MLSVPFGLTVRERCEDRRGDGVDRAGRRRFLRTRRAGSRGLQVLQLSPNAASLHRMELTLLFGAAVVVYLFWNASRNEKLKRKYELTMADLTELNHENADFEANFRDMLLKIDWHSDDNLNYGATTYKLMAVDGRFKISCVEKVSEGAGVATEYRIKDGASVAETLPTTEKDIEFLVPKVTLEVARAQEIEARRNEIEWHAPDDEIQAALQRHYTAYREFCAKYPELP